MDAERKEEIRKQIEAATKHTSQMWWNARDLLEALDAAEQRAAQLENDLYHQAHNASEAAANSIAIDAQLGRVEQQRDQAVAHLRAALAEIDDPDNLGNFEVAAQAATKFLEELNK